MKALIDTNIVIHRETKTPTIEDIGTLFYWLSKLQYSTCIHPITKSEILSNKNKDTVKAFTIKMESYELLREPPKLSTEVQNIIDTQDANTNDINDSKILNEVFCGRVDIFITEDKKIHKKATALGISDKVYTINSFLTKVKKEYPGLVDYDILEIRKKNFIDIDVTDTFFDSFREDYPEFNEWFTRKSSEEAYVLLNTSYKVEAFLYLKVEDKTENYQDITPRFEPKKRLKIGTLKVVSVGMRLGERFLKIIFDNARINKVDEIYVTIFRKNEGHEKLFELLEAWGFSYFGTKNNDELVYVRQFVKDDTRVNRLSPKKTYPYISQRANFYMIPIKDIFHTDLFPDSIIRGEKKEEFIDDAPHRNALSKCYVSGSPFKDLKSGDGIVFYRTGGIRPGYHNIVTTIGLVEGVVTDIKDEEELIKLTKNKTVFDEARLRAYFRRAEKMPAEYKLFVINFLYVGTLKRHRYPLTKLIELSIVDKAPRGVVKISRESFGELIEGEFS